jgi:transposase
LAEESARWQELNAKYESGHRARIVEDAVNQLDKRRLHAIYRGVGSSAYPPESLLKMVLFELLEGRNSPSQWHRDAGEHDVLKWLGRGVQPARMTWYRFRDRVDKVIHELNEQLVRHAVDKQWVCPEQAAQDGSTFRSQASRHQTFNQQRLAKRKECVQAAVEQDTRGEPLTEPIPKWMPQTVSGRLQLSERIGRAEQHLDDLLLENATKRKGKRREVKNIVVSLTDPEAPFARDKEKTFCFLYTSQMMVDSPSNLILGYSVAAENTDVGTLGPMIDRVQKAIGGTLRQVSADAGYASVLDLQDCFERGIDLLAPVSENSFSESKRACSTASKLFSRNQFQWVDDEQRFICPAGHPLTYKTKEHLNRHGDRQVICRHYRCAPQHCLACPLAKQCTTNPARGRIIKRLDGQELVDAQREKMKQPDIKQIYARRGQTIERAFADAKGHRSYGRLRGRGLARARAAIGLLVMAQNILTLHRLRSTAGNQENRRE